MKRKTADKLFDLVYTDAMTGTNNRSAYEEHISKLKRNNIRADSITVVAIKLDDLTEINDTMGNRTGDEAVKLAAKCIMQTVGEKADVYRMGDDEFLCISDKDVMSYISALRDLISFENRNKKYPFNVSICYMKYDNKRHENIDDLIKDCDRRLVKGRRPEQ